jgi:RNA-binding protein Tab2/Atab2
MTLWQADIYRRPLRSELGEPLWELLVCDRASSNPPDQPPSFAFQAACPQSAATADWLRAQLQQAIAQAGTSPQQIEAFRPQALALLAAACLPLGIEAVANRDVPVLKHWLQLRAREYTALAAYTAEVYDPLAIDRPPPVPLPELLLGHQWRFATIGASDFEQTLPYEPIPIMFVAPERLPLRLGLPSTTPIPGMVIDAGRRSMALAQWLQQHQPAWISYVPGQPDGVVLEAGLCDRWIIATFEDREVAIAGRSFEQRKQASQGLHFILVQPDDSGMTYTGLWLLQQPQ